MTPALRRYLPFCAAVLFVVVIASLAFGAGYRLGAATHRPAHARPSPQAR